jgi:hypothetical protein
MIESTSPAVMEFTDFKDFKYGRVAAAAIVFVLFVGSVGWPLFVWPLVALAHHVAVWPAAVYLTALTVLLVAGSFRVIRRGTWMDDDGLSVRGWLRSRRVGWPQVVRLTDGCTLFGAWGLTALLSDGRAVDCPCTGSGLLLADRGRLIQLRTAATRCGVKADMGGIPPQRPRAWEDAASVARRYRAWLVIWLWVAVAAVAGLVVVWVWNVRRPDYGPLPVPIGYVAIGAAVVAGWAVRWWRQALREGSAPADDRAEGDWFSVRLGRGRHAVAVVARRPPGCTVMLGYFFGPFESPRPAVDIIGELDPADAMLVSLGAARIWYGKPGGSRARLGRAEGWDCGSWPVPVFQRTDPVTKQSFKLFYNDQLRFVREEPADSVETEGLPAFGFIVSVEQLEARLRQQLGE